MSTQFTPGPTREVQPGDTPDLNDGLLSRAMADDNIARGTACYVKDGLVTIALLTDAALGLSPFVPIESVDNSGDDGLAMSGVVAPQRVALAVTTTVDLLPDDYVKISNGTGLVEKWSSGADSDVLKFARYLGREAALLDRKITSAFDETLTPGIVPDQSILSSESDGTVGWFQLVENPGA